MKHWILLGMLVVCKPIGPKNTSKPSSTSTPSSTSPTEPAISERETVKRGLSAYESQGCPTNERLGFDPGPHFVDLAETVKMPPWVAIRAASCVVRLHSHLGEGHFIQWVSHPGWAGLGRVVLERLDDLPEAMALSVASEALKGDLASHARTQLKESKYVRVRQLLAIEHTQ